MLKKHEAYTLVELTIVIVVIGVLAGIVMFGYRSFIKKTRVLQTKNKMQIIEAKMKEYLLTRGKLPCPAGIKIKVGGSGYGEEIFGSNGSCNQDLAKGVYKNKNVLLGGVPNKALGLSSKESLDAWGNKIIYVVDKPSTEKIVSSDTEITVTFHAGGNQNKVDNVAYVLISNGANQAGAITKNGEQISQTGKDSSLETENFYDGSSTGNFNAKDYSNIKMDDIVTFTTIDNILFLSRMRK